MGKSLKKKERERIKEIETEFIENVDEFIEKDEIYDSMLFMVDNLAVDNDEFDIMITRREIPCHKIYIAEYLKGEDEYDIRIYKALKLSDDEDKSELEKMKRYIKSIIHRYLVERLDFLMNYCDLTFSYNYVNGIDRMREVVNDYDIIKLHKSTKKYNFMIGRYIGEDMDIIFKNLIKGLYRILLSPDVPLNLNLNIIFDLNNCGIDRIDTIKLRRADLYNSVVILLDYDNNYVIAKDKVFDTFNYNGGVKGYNMYAKTSDNEQLSMLSTILHKLLSAVYNANLKISDNPGNVYLEYDPDNIPDEFIKSIILKEGEDFEYV